MMLVAVVLAIGVIALLWGLALGGVISHWTARRTVRFEGWCPVCLQQVDA